MKKECTFLVTCLVLVLAMCTAMSVHGQDDERPIASGTSTVQDIKAVQAVFDSDINGDGIQEIVAGKSLTVLVYLNDSRLSGLDKKQVVSVKVLYGGKPYFNNTATVEDINAMAYVPVKIGPATGTGHKVITAIADWNNNIPGLRGYDNGMSTSVNTVKTRGIRVLVVPVNGPGEDGRYGKVNRADYDRLFNQSYQFMKAVYPVADSGIEFVKYDGYFAGAPYIKSKRKNGTSLGILRDFKELAALGDEYGCDRVVGIIPRDYYAYHKYATGRNVLGNAITSKKLYSGPGRSVLVREDTKTGIVTAHEIGHTYGLNMGSRSREEYVSPRYHHKQSSGFNAARMQPVKGPCFMDSGSLVPRTYWVCEDTWKELFKVLLA